MAKSINPDIRKFPDLESLSRAVAEAVFEAALESVAENGFFSLVLAGGNTPRSLYGLLAMEYPDKMPWSSTHLFWGDERYVSMNDPDSNYKMSYQSLISKLSIPIQNVHLIPTEMENPEKAAASYEQHLREFFEISKGDATFDLILLGLGEDGHTASLFPGDSVLEEKERWVKAVLAPSTYIIRKRITLTLPVINRAKKVFFLASGARKKAVFKAISGDQEEATKRYPAAMVRPKGKVVWFVDNEVL